MNVKTKITAMFITTFVVGIIVGALINGAFHKKRISRINEMRQRGGFAEFIIDTVHPDETQIIKVREILERYSARLSEIREKIRTEFEANSDSMRTELSSVLTPEQNKLLEDKFKEMRGRRGRPGNRRGRRPPGDGQKHK
jgi:Spy/CpxP family protein refolding chaperone